MIKKSLCMEYANTVLSLCSNHNLKRKVIKIVLYTVISSALWSSVSLAESYINQSETKNKIESSLIALSTARDIYANAQKLADRGEWRKLNAIKHGLTNYPLYPYLEYAELVAKMSVPRRGEISRFLEAHEQTVLGYRLRSKWLEYLAQKSQWTNYIKYYAPEEASVSRQCEYLEALYNRNNRKAAFEGGIALWTVGHSQPHQCNKLFRILMRHEKITDIHAWKRFNLALLNHNYSLARYVKQFMTGAQTKDLAEAFMKIKRNPKYLLSGVNEAINRKDAIPLIAHSLSHLANRNPTTAIDFWSNWEHRESVGPTETHEFISRVVKSFVKSDKTQHADRVLIRYKDLINTEFEGILIEWRIRHALSEQNWTDVQGWIEKLPIESKKKSVWRYWRIRSLENNGVFNRQETYRLKTELSKERDFYGFISSDSLNQDYNFNHIPVPKDEVTLKEISSNLALQRARELNFHGKKVDANREWNSGTRDFTREQWMAVAQLAHNWGWHSRAIIAMASAKYWDDLQIRFPLAFYESIDAAAKKAQVQSHLLYAIARQESAFEIHARSKVGALGLLQIMPRTARSTARNSQIPYENSRQLTDINTNLLIGSSYFRSLLERFDENKILALASYNAGPERVKQWLSRTKGKLTYDLWIELIPYSETRGYVKSALMYSTIYSEKLGLQKPMLEPYEIELLL